MKNFLFLILAFLFASPSYVFSQEWKNFAPEGFGVKFQAPPDFTVSSATADEYIVANSRIELVLSPANDQFTTISEMEDMLTVWGAITGMESDWNIETINPSKIPGLNGMKITGNDDIAFIEVVLLYLPENYNRSTYIEVTYSGEDAKAVVEKILCSFRPR